MIGMLVVGVGVSCLLATVSAATSYQYVRFINDKKQQPSHTANNEESHKNPTGVRSTRSYGFHPFVEYVDIDNIWPEHVLITPGDSIFDINLEQGNYHHQFAPVYGNAIEHHDPLLLTGRAAKEAVNYIYGKGELFFKDIPHWRAMVRLQEKRKINGLQPNRLGSLNARSPFYRDRNSNFY